MKRISCIIVSLSLALSLALPAAAAEVTFADVPRDHWAYDYIQEMNRKGVVTGMGGGLFEPEGPVSTAQFAVMLTAAFCPETVNTDVPIGTPWWMPYLEAARAAGYLTDTTASWDYFQTGAWNEKTVTDPMTRYDMAMAMWNTVMAEDMALPTDRQREAAQRAIGDFGAIPEDYESAVVAMYALGLLSGVNDKGDFGGAGTMTRAQSCVVMRGLLNWSASGQGEGTSQEPAPEKAQQPEETQEPEKSQQPEETQEPEETQQPEKTQEPEKSQQPEETQEPEKSQQPEKTQEPEETQQPEEAQEPEQPAQPEEKPEDAQKPQETQQPTQPEQTETTAPADDGEADSGVDVAAWEQEVFNLVNQIREENGLPPFVYNGTLAETARAHSQDMVDRNFFNHNNPDGQSPFDRMKANGIRYSMAAENIAAGYPSPEAVVEGWMNSEGHRANILGGCKELGVGLALGGSYGYYWTQCFATVR